VLYLLYVYVLSTIIYYDYVICDGVVDVDDGVVGIGIMYYWIIGIVGNM
jgi:hypothetical protein